MRRRGGRLVLLLALTGCAVEPPAPAPAPASLPPPAAVPPPVISRFGDWHGAGGGPRPWQHAGLDIRAPIGTPVLAAADGEVLRAGTRPFAGKMVVLGHAEDVTTVYMHLSEIWVRVGQLLRRGEPLGRSGMTGNATAPHLHFGLCQRPEGLCGVQIRAGWDDPDRHWVEGNPCYDAGHAYPPGPVRLTFPLPCSGSVGSGESSALLSRTPPPRGLPALTARRAISA